MAIDPEEVATFSYFHVIDVTSRIVDFHTPIDETANQISTASHAVL
jgi:hypothetical protein